MRPKREAVEYETEFRDDAASVAQGDYLARKGREQRLVALCFFAGLMLVAGFAAGLAWARYVY